MQSIMYSEADYGNFIKIPKKNRNFDDERSKGKKKDKKKDYSRERDSKRSYE